MPNRPDPGRAQTPPPVLRIIGWIETPYRTLAECPRNVEVAGSPCRIHLATDYAPGLLGLEPGQEILVLYWLDQADRDRLCQNSRRTGVYSGVFALRTPNRPNPIGAALVAIETRDDTSLVVRGLDCLNGTLLLDLKPARGNERSAPGKENHHG